MTVQLLSKAAYARHRGCDEKAVRKAINEGRISAIGGKIDPAVADIQWERNTRARVRTAAPGHADLLTMGPSNTQAGSSGSSSAATFTGGRVELADRAASSQAGQGAAAAEWSSDASYSEARTRRERAEAEEAEMRTAKMRGSMVMRDDVDRAMFEIGRELRDRLTACARRVAAEVANIQTAEGCEAVIDREHRIVLDLLVTHFREKIGAPAKDPA